MSLLLASVNRQYRCGKCNYEVCVYTARCRKCGEWNCVDEIFREAGEDTDNELPEPVSLMRVNGQEDYRISTKDEGFDFVLGGGLLPGSVILLSGDPGIGKSTLLLQVADSIRKPMLYANGEESAFQTSLRAERLGIRPETSQVLLLPEQNIEKLLRVAEAHKPIVLAVDSIQMLWSEEIESAAGSTSQVRECTNQLVSFAKKTDIPVIIIGHITKGGTIAGPKAMEHGVDVVMSFTMVSDVLRNLKCSKNRFGSIVNSAHYSMEDAGLRFVG